MLSNLNVDVMESFPLEIINKKTKKYNQFLSESRKIDKDIVEFVENSKIENVKEKGIILQILYIIISSYSNIPKEKVKLH